MAKSTPPDIDPTAARLLGEATAHNASARDALKALEASRAAPPTVPAPAPAPEHLEAIAEAIADEVTERVTQASIHQSDPPRSIRKRVEKWAAIIGAVFTLGAALQPLFDWISKKLR